MERPSQHTWLGDARSRRCVRTSWLLYEMNLRATQWERACVSRHRTDDARNSVQGARALLSPHRCVWLCAPSSQPHTGPRRG